MTVMMKKQEAAAAAAAADDDDDATQEPYLAGPAGALLAAVPKLSAESDHAQLDGLSRLATAMAALAASRSSSASSIITNGNGGAQDGAGSSTTEAAALTVQLQDAVKALRCVVHQCKHCLVKCTRRRVYVC